MAKKYVNLSMKLVKYVAKYVAMCSPLGLLNAIQLY